jgi:hypothetical protein
MKKHVAPHFCVQWEMDRTKIGNGTCKSSAALTSQKTKIQLETYFTKSTMCISQAKSASLTTTFSSTFARVSAAKREQHVRVSTAKREQRKHCVDQVARERHDYFCLLGLVRTPQSCWPKTSMNIASHTLFVDGSECFLDQ